MINVVVITGRLTKDPELSFTPNGVPVTNITLAVNRSFGDNQADYINCVVWKKQAENTVNYMRKGGMMTVSGRIQTRNYDGQDGKRVFITEVVAEQVQFLGGKGSNSENQSGFGGSYGGQQGEYNQGQGGYSQSNQNNYNQGNQTWGQGQRSNTNQSTFPNTIDISDDDLPF